jgi:hypothetical protein
MDNNKNASLNEAMRAYMIMMVNNKSAVRKYIEMMERYYSVENNKKPILRFQKILEQ